MNISKVFLLSLSLLSSVGLVSVIDGKPNSFDASTYEQRVSPIIRVKVGEEFSINGLNISGYPFEENGWKHGWKPNYDTTELIFLGESFVINSGPEWDGFCQAGQTLTFKALKPGKIMLSLSGTRSFKIVAE